MSLKLTGKVFVSNSFPEEHLLVAFPGNLPSITVSDVYVYPIWDRCAHAKMRQMVPVEYAPAERIIT